MTRTEWLYLEVWDGIKDLEPGALSTIQRMRRERLIRIRCYLERRMERTPYNPRASDDP